MSCKAERGCRRTSRLIIVTIDVEAVLPSVRSSAGTCVGATDSGLADSRDRLRLPASGASVGPDAGCAALTAAVACRRSGGSRRRP